MTRRTIAVASFLVFAGTTGSLAAQQAAPIVGKWNIDYEAGRRIEGGVATSVMGKGVLSIAQQSDSLVATLEGAPRPDGSPNPPVSFVGKLSANGAVFVQQRQAQVHINGEISTVTLVQTWTLRANGDELSGTIARELPPELAQAGGAGEPAPLKGTRIKG